MQFIELLALLEGGNVEALNKKTGEKRLADKIGFDKLPINQFRNDFYDLFKELNKIYIKKYDSPLWEDLDDIKSGLMFNGSTSYIMNPNMSPDEILKYKSGAGDLDIIIPETSLKNLWYILDELEGERISHFIYHGCNRHTPESVGVQINTVFEHIKTKVNCQIDFEGLPFEGGKPTEFAKFGHSSSFEDAKKNIKAVHHKYLLRAIVASLSEAPDIVVATPASTPEKIRIKKIDGPAKLVSFSVDRGLRTTLAPMLDDNGNQVYFEGKPVYKEIKTSESDYITSIDKIIKYMFGVDVPKNDIMSFTGLVKLIKTHFSKDLIKKINERYFKLLFGKGSQMLELRNPQLDYEVKIAGYDYFTKMLKIRNNQAEKEIQKYYGDDLTI